MRHLLTFILLTLCNITVNFAQQNLKGRFIEKVKVENVERDLQINYSLKSKTASSQLLKVRFFNKTKANLNVDLVIGVYNNGVLLEKADIVHCLKKSFFNNFFRPYHLVQTSISSNKTIEIKILNLLTEQVDECRQAHK